MPAALNNASILIVPGWQDSAPDHWQSHWQNTFGWKRVIQKDWMTPQLEDWVTALITAVHAEPTPPILITHSLGGTTLAHAVSKHSPLPVRGAFIVAPPDLDQGDTPSELHNFRPTPLIRFPFPSALIASSNDPLSRLAQSEKLARRWGSTFHCVGDRLHIGSTAQLGEWEEGLRLFTGFWTAHAPK